MNRDGRTAASSGTLLILALDRQRRSKLPTPDEADLRLLLALETFPADADGVRSAGMEELARAAGVPYATARRSRDRLVADGLVACEAGSGRGVLTKWRFTSALKVLSQGEQDLRSGRCSPVLRDAKGPKVTRRRGRASPPPRCRVCHEPLDTDPAVAATGIHPCCEPDDAPDYRAPRRDLSEVSKRHAAEIRATLQFPEPRRKPR
jgi:hypothetical protein